MILFKYLVQSQNSSYLAFPFGIARNITTNGDKLVPGDYTGDGKADFAIFRPSTNQWFVLRGENSWFYACPFGASGEIAAPSDYDGDGKFDAAVFRPATATWFVMRSSDSGVTFATFGTSGDQPIPNAYVR